MNVSILWVDDEIDLLSPHIMFLEQRSYTVSTATNGHDALDLVASNDFDIVFLDENMPGISGLETLAGIKQAKPNLPVVMVTKSEEESIMDQAVGAKIADYLIKPVKPNQVLLSVKKHVHKDKQRQPGQLRAVLLDRGGGREDDLGHPLGRGHGDGPLDRAAHPRDPGVDHP